MYDAFISYSHAKDAAIASGLQSVMQTLGKAWWQRRRLRIFRDETSLSVTDALWPQLEEKLKSSRFLVLLASPEAGSSKWVDKEVSAWFEHYGSEHGRRTLLIALTAGELAWDKARSDFDWDTTVPLPPSVRGRFVDEPLWVDLRAFRSRAEQANKKNQNFATRAGKIAARILGVPLEDLLSQELREQRRNLRLAWGGITTLLILALVASGLGLIALRQSRIAQD